MTRKNEKFLNLPQGTEGIHLEEALKHRIITRELNDLFTSWGYFPVNTPVFDFYDNYRKFLEGKAGDNIYRLMDREGDLLMLRSDVTLFLARQMGLYLQEADLPVRVSYADTILRHQNREDISKNEFFQTGVELIGREGFDGDMEVLLLLNRTLSILSVPCCLHLGSRNLFNQIFTEPGQNRLGQELLQTRDREGLKKLLEESHSAETAAFLTRMFLFIGSREELMVLLKKGESALPPGALKESRYLLRVMEQLESVEAGGDFRLDLSEIGSQPYHTGIVFQVYMDGLDSAVASGGRYDTLLENFGFKAPSVGFSILLRKIEDHLKRKDFSVLPQEPVSAPGISLMERYNAAEKLRKKGSIVVL